MAEFLITFREVLEAVLIIGILYSFLNKSDQNRLIPFIWRGVWSAVALSTVCSVVFQLVAGGFSGRAEEIFEGVVMILAAVILSTMIVWMARNKSVAQDLQVKAQKIIDGEKKGGMGIFLLSFLAVFREGAEIILFLYGIAIKQGGLSFVMSIMGGTIAASIGYLIFVQSKKVPLKTFFNISSIVLIFIAGGLIAHGIHEFEEAGLIPYHGAVWDLNPMVHTDGSFPPLHEKGYIGSIAKGLFGWNGNPSKTEVFAWTFSIGFIGLLWKKASQP
tara:strand:- start:2007 stop:2828 length:822 start_codon:yes stop_codon:yes gene_type:complete